MAKPHGKNLMGHEGGKLTSHWYDFIKSRRAILRSRIWDGGCPVSKSGVTIAIWLGFDENGKDKWGSLGK